MKLFRLDIITFLTADTKDAAIGYALMIKEDLETNSLIEAVPFLGLTEYIQEGKQSDQTESESKLRDQIAGGFVQ